MAEQRDQPAALAAPEQFPKDPWYRKYYYDPRKILWNCSRCSCCKWIDSWEVKDARFARVCPSNTRYLFDAYSCQGRHDIILALVEGRIQYEDSPKLLDVIYKCDTCGGCDVSCKRNRDTEPLRVLLDTRAKLVEDGQLLPQHMPVMQSLRKDDNMMFARRALRGRWAEGLGIKDLAKETAEVVLHVGCQSSFNEDLWPIARSVVKLLQHAGVDFGILGKEEVCCGCRSYDMGYRGTSTKYAEHNIETWKRARVKAVVTACADCYWAFKRLYPELGLKIPVYHIVEYVSQLLADGKLSFTKSIPLHITYHDPCHLGRRANNYVPGKAIMGVYEAPRQILKRIPGVELTEMFRIKEYAWCCGAGGGVKEAYPDFSLWTAGERIAEAKATGADALVTACPWCESNFRESIADRGEPLQVLDVIELVAQAL